MKIALVVPHIFMHQQILPDVIFSPGRLALNLAETLAGRGHQVTLFTPGPVDEFISDKKIANVTADLARFEQELAQRDDIYLDLLKKHPLTYITLARQVQSELIAAAYEQANQGKFDLVHVWCNEEEQALVNARFCQKPVVFNHHEPFNFLTRYRAIFPKYPQLNWISFSQAQRQTFGLPEEKVNWVGNVYHGLPKEQFQLQTNPEDYWLYMGRIIKPKGVHYAIQMAKKAGKKLKIAGKHYAGHSKDKYWQEFVKPELESDQIEYVGFVRETEAKQELLGKAAALLMPSTWQEPFGMVMIEALACGTPVIGFNRGSLPEVVENSVTGWLVDYKREEKLVKNGKKVNKNRRQLQQDKAFQQNLKRLLAAAEKLEKLDRKACRQEFEKRFTLEKMADGYEKIYQKLTSNNH